MMENGAHEPAEWSTRYAAALVRMVDARGRSEDAPDDPALAAAYQAAAGDVDALAKAAAGEFVFMARKAGEHITRTARLALTPIVGDAVEQALAPIRQELAQLVEAVAELERQRRAP